MIHVDIDFEMLVDAFEQSDLNHIFYLDTKTGTLIYYNDLVGEPVDFEKYADEYEQNPRYVGLPTRDSRDDYFIMEMFAYTLPTFQLAQQFHTVLEQEKPFKHFRHLLHNHPDLQKKWNEYRYNSLKNEIVNWLFDHHLELIDQQLIPEITIKELNRSELKQLPGELKGFHPYACLQCDNKKDLKARWFLCSMEPENKLMEQKLKSKMKQEFNVEDFGHFGGGKHHYLTAACCPKCGSENIFWDF